jgi:TatA/E family protein of Tat protein translocase
MMFTKITIRRGFAPGFPYIGNEGEGEETGFVMFNMNPFEMVVIGIIALVVVGPRGLPELGRMVGKWMKTFREAADEMKRGLYYDDDYRHTPKQIPSSLTSEPHKEITPTEPVHPVETVESGSAEETPLMATGDVSSSSPVEPTEPPAHEASGVDSKDPVEVDRSTRQPLIQPYTQDACD